MAKILIFDLETAGVNSFKPDLATMLCFGYKWLGASKAHVLTVDQYPGWFSKRHGLNDRGLLKAALRLMEEADLIVAHYGERFDRRFLQGRCAIHGFEPPPPTKLRDTWQIARRAFCFSSNRLQNLVDALGLPFKKYDKKVPDEWPGWWLRALAGDASAIKAMAKYCKQDVLALEGLYVALQVYDSPHPRMVMDRSLCGVCGGHVEYRGCAYVGENKYRRYVCKRCHRWGRESRAYKER